MGKKILFVDIDDTLLTRSKEITPENRKAIHEAVQAGHEVVITTGRPLLAMTRFLDDLNLREKGCYAITFNGAEIYDCYADKVIYRNPVKKKAAVALYEEAVRLGYYCQFYDEDDKLVCLRLDENAQFYINHLRIPYRVPEDFLASIPEHPIKMMLLDVNSHEHLEQFKSSHKEWAEGKFEMFYSNPAFLECVAPGTSKGTALRRLAEMQNVPIENTIAAGDSENDLSMIEAAGVGCAMKNADDCVKDIADYITENDCDNSGVAEIINRFMLNEK